MITIERLDIRFDVEGNDEEQAAKALLELINNRFGEEQ